MVALASDHHDSLEMERPAVEDGAGSEINIEENRIKAAAAARVARLRGNIKKNPIELTFQERVILGRVWFREKRKAFLAGLYKFFVTGPRRIISELAEKLKAARRPVKPATA